MNTLKERIVRSKNAALRLVKIFLSIFGVFAFSFFILSFTDLPYLAYHKLGTTHADITEDPDVIVIFGGSGMPSPDGFIKAYYAAKVANKYADSRIIIALPYSDHDSLKQLRIMANELILKGIDSTRISFEPLGVNTRTQAVNIASMLQIEQNQLSILVVTTPEHMYRAIYTLINAGCHHVAGLPTFEKPIEEKKLIDAKTTKDITVDNLSFRYNMWSYMNYELLVLREYMAISYYKYKGWL